ncbi:hypothetical protein MRB56_12625 [Halomonas cupida]|uniref:hypothetical protein n=1 Tax=Halomonas cupida TaxID=44933 RepID=UPI0039B58807
MLLHPFGDAVLKAMRKPNVTILYAVELHLPSGISRAHSGTGAVVINGHTFLGVGQFGKVSTTKEETASYSPSRLTLTLTGLTPSIVADSINERMRGRVGRLYMAVLDEDGQVAGADLMFSGKITDSGVTTGDTNEVSITLADRFEDWKRKSPDRFTDESHSARYPGDRLFRYVAQMAERAIYWGSKKDAPGFYYE